jgi:hypothetical protein
MQKEIKIKKSNSFNFSGSLFVCLEKKKATTTHLWGENIMRRKNEVLL